MRKWFHLIGWAEGISLLLLLLVAMPLKYSLGMPGPTKALGSIHGFLFLLYGWCALQLSNQEEWPAKLLPLSILLSCLPFGTFVFERYFQPKRISTEVPESLTS